MVPNPSVQTLHTYILERATQGRFPNTSRPRIEIHSDLVDLMDMPLEPEVLFSVPTL